VTQNEEHLYENSSWVLYHGTSTARLQRILRDDSLRTSRTGRSEGIFNDRAFCRRVLGLARSSSVIGMTTPTRRQDVSV
jgi:hypothetical protein